MLWNFWCGKKLTIKTKQLMMEDQLNFLLRVVLLLLLMFAGLRFSIVVMPDAV